MKNIQWNNVRMIIGTMLVEKTRALFVTPLVYSLALVIIMNFIDNSFSRLAEDCTMFTIPLSMIMPTIFVIQKFVGESQLQQTIAIPASNPDKYTAMISLIIIQSFIWLAVMFISDIVFLLIISNIIYGAEPSAVLSVIFDTKYLLQIIPMIYMTSLVGWWKIASRTTSGRRYADYVTVVMSFIIYLFMVPMFYTFGRTAMFAAITIYSLLVIIFALVRSYHNFKRIITNVNK